MLSNDLREAVLSEQCSQSVADAIIALADAAKIIAKFAARTGLPDSDFGALAGGNNADGDDQKALDVLADDEIAAKLTSAKVCVYLSEERDAPVLLNPEYDRDESVMVAADPLDGSSNIDTNLTVGTIFSILPAPETFSEAACLMRGRAQRAAGFFLYGPQTGLMLTLGDGVQFFVLNEDGQFERADFEAAIPATYPEFAINMSNQRFWPAPVAAYMDALTAGSDGPLARHYNMKWCASLVADAFRIFRRGGIFLYPEDNRSGYENGRLRLIYEAHPIAFLIEQAGGIATDGVQPILDKIPTSLHARSALIFGSADDVKRYETAYQTGKFHT